MGHTVTHDTAPIAGTGYAGVGMDRSSYYFTVVSVYHGIPLSP